MKRYIHINPADNVAVALCDLAAGEIAEGIALLQDVKRGHKFALADIPAGSPVVKYGYPIGHATQPIAKGEWIHSHNLATSLSDNLEYCYEPHLATPKCASIPAPQLTGFQRSNGDMGIRNELWVVPTVGCVNGQANSIVRRLRQECDLQGIDDVRALTHNYGCSQLGDDHANTRKALAAIARHPNAGGVLVLGLGCENNQIARLREEIGEYDAERVKFLVAQEVDDEVETGVEICKELIAKMKGDKRVPMPISKLRVGLKCGGSDGLSGITANPLVGMLTDWLTCQGATAVLTEVPEMFGAETILMSRAKDDATFSRVVSLINDFKDYFRRDGQPIYENPSPGNKEGGITTLEEKSLGCVQKGGKAIVTDVLKYGDKAVAPGLNLLSAPGNDLVASTALALSGCQLVLFTTGRGTPFGTFVPTMKISTNTALAEKKRSWIDFNAGTIVTGEPAVSALQRLIDKVAATVNGDQLLHELHDAKEIAIFKSGVTL